MGEQADLIIDGQVCELCSAKFKAAHGYPAVCKDCWRDLTKEERKHHQQAIAKTEN